MPFDTTRSFFNVDIGLYRKFEIVEEEIGQGRPTGCPGLDRPDWLENKKHRTLDILGNTLPNLDTSTALDFNPESENYYLKYSSKNMPGNSIAENRLSDVIAGNPFSGCPLNEERVENGEVMYEIVEEFANSNQEWVNQFVPAFNKMLENGYQGPNNPNNGLEELNGIKWEDLYLRCENREKCGKSQDPTKPTKDDFNCEYETYPGNI